MKKLRALLTVLALLVSAHSCFALQSNSPRPELVCNHGIMDYTIPYGDTLTWIARYYHADMTDIARANHIKDMNRIHAGNTMMIPCGICPMMTRHAATVRKTVRTASHSTHHARRDRGTSVPQIVATHETIELQQSPVYQQTLALQETETLPITEQSFVETPTAATTVAATAAPTQREPTPSPSRSRSSKVKKTKKVKGYKLVLTAQEAKADGLTLNRDLNARIIFFKTEEDKMHGIKSGERHHLRARAKREGNNIALFIPLGARPEQPFIIFILGANQPIDGDYLMANAQPFSGRFPGPNRFERCFFAGGKMLVNTTIITFASGGNFPLGIAMGFGVPVIRGALQHHVNMIQENAEDTLFLTYRQTDFIPQPAEITVANSQN